MDEFNSEPIQKAVCFCSYCGTKLDDGARFCKNCGEPVMQPLQSAEETSYTEVPKTETKPPKTEQVREDPRTKRTTVYDGEIHKCPNCGELLKSFTTVCPACGYELRSVRTNSSVEALAKKVELASSLEDKNELITNFYIPNTKEDIYDFFILAVSNLEDKQYDTDDAWQAKLEQAYHKAKISFGNTDEFEYLEKLYIQTRKEVRKRERGISAVFERNKVTCVTALLFGVGILMIIIGIILFSADSIRGILLAAVGFWILTTPSWALEEMKKKEGAKSRRKGISKKNSSITESIGKDAEEFLYKNYSDMAEFLKSRGFRNVVTKPERKGLLEFEGAVKGISVAGNTEFNKYDEFDIDTKIIIRYSSRKY